MSPQKSAARTRKGSSCSFSATASCTASFLPRCLPCFCLSLVLSICFMQRVIFRKRNRKLQAYPAPTATSILDGSFMSKLQAAFSDQFFARDRWISTKLRIDELLGQKESNGVYLCQDDYLIEVPEAPDQAVLGRTLTAMKNFAVQHDDLPYDRDDRAERFLRYARLPAKERTRAQPAGGSVRGQSDALCPLCSTQT